MDRKTVRADQESTRLDRKSVGMDGKMIRLDRQVTGDINFDDAVVNLTA
jgi:hypothetical protein